MGPSARRREANDWPIPFTEPIFVGDAELLTRTSTIENIDTVISCRIPTNIHNSDDPIAESTEEETECSMSLMISLRIGVKNVMKARRTSPEFRRLNLPNRLDRDGKNIFDTNISNELVDNMKPASEILSDTPPLSRGLCIRSTINNWSTEFTKDNIP
mmetsp:Transcript_10567/g.25821  ORF Transcript_10567/g.25821 Transcript_10567/m.25821 type:complete len:158 (-) Transcript_10567:741-1214(-)